jgi:hypothetical protein
MNKVSSFSSGLILNSFDKYVDVGFPVEKVMAGRLFMVDGWS